jgi:Family of unknown function (DUF5694)
VAAPSFEVPQPREMTRSRCIVRAMGRRSFSCSLILAFFLIQTNGARAGNESAEQLPEVMILGVYHMGDIGLDPRFAGFKPTNSPERQKQIIELVDRLARFRPTRIAIEFEPRRADQIAERYRKFLATGQPDNTGETAQLSFRLAKKLGLRELCLVDYKNNYSYDAVEAYEKRTGGPRSFRPSRPSQLTDRWLDERFSVGEMLAVYNSELYLRRAHAYELVHLDSWQEGDEPGPELATKWYDRNLRIYARIRRCMRDNRDRVLVVVGAGHAPLLRRFVQDAHDLKLVSPRGFLPAAPPEALARLRKEGWSPTAAR